MLRTRNTKRKQRGWVPPGYKYLGPFNDLHLGPPTNIADQAAQKHDWAYYELERQGKRPKLEYNEADDVFMEEVGTDGIAPFIAKKLFQLKRKAAEVGLIPDIRPSQRWQRTISDAGFLNRLANHQIRSLPNLPPTPPVNTMSEGNNKGSGNEVGLKETPVDDPRNFQIYRGPPDYTFASLPYYDDYTAGREMWVHDFAWRPTSPYDCKVDQANSIDLNTVGLGVSTHYPVNPYNTSDSSIDKARWFDYYASIYKYYHVIACRYEIYVENFSNEDVFCHLMPINDVEPPIGATNRDMMCWKDCQTKVLCARALAVEATGNAERPFVADNVVMDEASATAGTNYTYENGNHIENNVGRPTAVFKGVYRTGDYDRQIRLDANVENWTAVNTNPALVERLLLRVKPYWDSWSVTDGNTRNRTLRFSVKAKLDYLVEFKELRDGLKYPTNDQPYTATINQNN